MKSKYFLGAFVSACVIFTGCSDDVLEENNNIPWQEGDGIVFGARAGFENPDKQSRTIYTGKTYTDKDGKIYEGIDWIPEVDFITILSPQANASGGGIAADYKVVSNAHGTTPEESNKDYAALVAATKDKALQWGTAEEHQFYACYPTFASTTIEGNREFGIKMEQKNGKVKVFGKVPHNQIPFRLDYVDLKDDMGTSTYKGYIARPVMRNAHMVAYSTHKKSDATPVDLTFKSIVTALEIDLVGVNPAGTTIVGALIGTNDPSQKLIGNYECEINEGLQSGYPTCRNTTHGVTNNQILIPLLFKDHPVYGSSNQVNKFTTPQGVLLKEGEHLKFTAFILPEDGTGGLKDITLTLISMTGRKQHLINIPQEKFKAHLKHYVNNVKIPTSYSSRNWMSRLNDNVYLSQLSIPGTGDSYSFGTTKSYSQTQTLNIEDQWNMGIRCFEITSDRNLAGSGGLTSLGPVDISSSSPILNRKTVNDVVKQINALVKGVKGQDGKPSECAIIIMNYQPAGNTRNVFKYIDNFINYVNNTYAYGLTNVIKYDPNLTLREVRGKLLFILRPSSDGEDILNVQTYNKPENKFIIANGWGSLQDKWKQRGYPVTDTNPGDNFNGNNAHDDWDGSIEKSIIIENSTTVPTKDQFTYPAKGTPNFEYDTNSNLSVWAQEWNRVVPGKYPIIDTDNLNDPNLANVVYVLNYANNDYVAWKESYNEKLSDAKGTFEKAVQDATSNYLYINCLTGYFINPSDNNTYAPSRHNTSGIFDNLYYGSKKGDVTSFAKVINKDFFAYMWEQWNKRITAPMGIVMMNRVGSGDVNTNPENFYMPNIVISNNFSFPLKTKVTK